MPSDRYNLHRLQRRRFPPEQTVKPPTALEVGRSKLNSIIGLVLKGGKMPSRGTPESVCPSDQVTIVDDDLVDTSAVYAPMSGAERHEWAMDLRREAVRFLALANRLNPEHAKTAIIEGTEMTKLGERLRNALHTLSTQQRAISQHKLQMETVLAEHRAQIDSIVAQNRAQITNSEAKIAAIMASHEKLQTDYRALDTSNQKKATLIASLEHQMGVIKNLFGSVPDAEDEKVIADFDKAFAKPVPPSVTSSPPLAGDMPLITMTGTASPLAEVGV